MEKNKALLPEWMNIVSAIVVDKEYRTDSANMESEDRDLDNILDMLICERPEKTYDWQSNIDTADYAAIHWTQIGELVAQYFTKKDKVDCPPATINADDILKAKAAKEFLNYHLNARYMHYLQKFIRFNSLNRNAGWVVLKLFYESDIEIEQVMVGTQKKAKGVGVDIYGNPIDESPYPERMSLVEEPVYQQVKRIHKDRPNFEVWPNQNVYMDNKYCYSLAEKDHVIFESEEKLSKLKADAEANRYFNLELLTQDTETDAANKTENKNTAAGKKYERIIQKYDPDINILERWGKWPVVFDENGMPHSGIDDDGNMMEGAEIMETIITVANIKSGKVLIRFQPNTREHGGYGFRPMVRMLCYVHPTKDRGIGDGKYGYGLQNAINDNFNMVNDRTNIATYPTIKKKKFALIDNDTLQFGPEHVMELENLDDIDMMNIPDAPQGAYNQGAILFQKLQQVHATFTTDMGGFPQRREAVTTTMMAAEKSNTRNTLVNLTVEHTGLAEFYDMLLKISGMFMQPETLMNVLGELTYFFDPEVEYNFTPVSTAILTENSKENKIAMLDQLIGRLVNVPNPRVFAIINMLMKEVFELMGKEYAQYGHALLDENFIPPSMMLPPPAQGGGGSGPTKQKKQNQHGNKQTATESKVRQIGTRAGGGQR